MRILSKMSNFTQHEIVSKNIISVTSSHDKETYALTHIEHNTLAAFKRKNFVRKTVKKKHSVNEKLIFISLSLSEIQSIMAMCQGTVTAMTTATEI